MAIDYEELARRQKALGQSGSGNGNGVTWDKLKAGNNFRRILPVNDSYGIPGVKRVVHWVEQNGKNTALTCPRTFIPDGSKQHYDCPLCDWAYQNKDSQSKVASRVRGQLSYLMWVIDRDDNDTVKLLPLGKRAYESLLEALANTDYRGMTEFTAADGGRDICIKRSGTGLETSFSILPRVQCSDAAPGKSIVEVMADLEDIQDLIDPVDMTALQQAVDRLNGNLPFMDTKPSQADADASPNTAASASGAQATAAAELSGSEYADWSIPRLSREVKQRGIQGSFPNKGSMIAALDADDQRALQELNGGSETKDDLPWGDGASDGDDVMAAMRSAVGGANASPYARKA